MSTSFHKLSFVYGIICALLFVSLVGAARNVDRTGPEYDAVPVGGRGLQIVSHGTNTLHNYIREVDGDVVKYKLVETIDLSVTGRAEIISAKFE